MLTSETKVVPTSWMDADLMEWWEKWNVTCGGDTCEELCGGDCWKLT